MIKTKASFLMFPVKYMLVNCLMPATIFKKRLWHRCAIQLY